MNHQNSSQTNSVHADTSWITNQSSFDKVEESFVSISFYKHCKVSPLPLSLIPFPLPFPSPLPACVVLIYNQCVKRRRRRRARIRITSCLPPRLATTNTFPDNTSAPSFSRPCENDLLHSLSPLRLCSHLSHELFGSRWSFFEIHHLLAHASCAYAEYILRITCHVTTRTRIGDRHTNAGTKKETNEKKNREGTIQEKTKFANSLLVFNR